MTADRTDLDLTMCWSPGRRDLLTYLGQRVVVTGDCWIVDGVPDRYLRVAVPWGVGSAHRLVFEEVHGVRLASDVHVHHTCELPGCIRPDHLVALSAGDHTRVHAGTAAVDDVALDIDSL